MVQFLDSIYAIVNSKTTDYWHIGWIDGESCGMSLQATVNIYWTISREYVKFLNQENPV